MLCKHRAQGRAPEGAGTAPGHLSRGGARCHLEGALHPGSHAGEQVPTTPPAEAPPLQGPRPRPLPRRHLGAPSPRPDGVKSFSLMGFTWQLSAPQHLPHGLTVCLQGCLPHQTEGLCRDFNDLRLPCQR